MKIFKQYKFFRMYHKNLQKVFFSLKFIRIVFNVTDRCQLQ